MEKEQDADPSCMEVVEEVVVDAAGSVGQNVPIFEPNEVDLSTAIELNSTTDDAKRSRADPRMRSKRVQSKKPASSSKTGTLGNEKKQKKGVAEGGSDYIEKFKSFARKDKRFSALHEEIAEKIKASKFEAYLSNPNQDFREYPGYFFALTHCLKRANAHYKCLSKDDLEQMVKFIDICENVPFEAISKTTESSKVYAALKQWTCDKLPMKRTNFKELLEFKETLSQLVKELRNEAARQNLDKVTQRQTAIFLLFTQPLVRINFVFSLRNLLHELYKPLSEADYLEAETELKLLPTLNVQRKACVFCMNSKGKVVSFDFVRMLTQHIIQSHSLWHLKCPRCDEFFKNINTGNTHYKKAHAKVNCEDCSLEFVGLDEYDRHSCAHPDHETKQTKEPIIMEKTQLDGGDEEGLEDLFPVVFEPGKFQIVPIGQPMDCEHTLRDQKETATKPSTSPEVLINSTLNESPSLCLGLVGNQGPCFVLKKKENSIETGLVSESGPLFTKDQLERALAKLRDEYEKKIEHLTMDLVQLQEQNQRLQESSSQTLRENSALNTEVQILRDQPGTLKERAEKRRAEDTLHPPANLTKMQRHQSEPTQP